MCNIANRFTAIHWIKYKPGFFIVFLASLVVGYGEKGLNCTSCLWLRSEGETSSGVVACFWWVGSRLLPLSHLLYRLEQQEKSVLPSLVCNAVLTARSSFPCLVQNCRLEVYEGQQVATYLSNRKHQTTSQPTKQSNQQKSCIGWNAELPTASCERLIMLKDSAKKKFT